MKDGYHDLRGPFKVLRSDFGFQPASKQTFWHVLSLSVGVHSQKVVAALDLAASLRPGDLVLWHDISQDQRARVASLQPSLLYLEFPAVLPDFRNFVATFVQLRQVTASNLRCPSDLGIRRLSGIVRVLALELAPGSD